MVRTGRPVMPTYGVLLLVTGLTLNLSMVLATFNAGVHPDFIGLHAAARELDSGRPLYSTTIEGTRNLNPPQIAVAMWPLARLSVYQAIVVWWAVCAACAWVCVRLWGLVLPAPYPLIVLGVILVTPSGYGALRFGAWTWPLTALATSAWIAFRNGDRGRAGALLGVFAALRVFALLFVPYLLWKRQWRALARFSVTFVAVWAVGFAVCGPQAYMDWVSVLGSIDVYGDYYNSSLMGFSTRLVGDRLGQAEWVAPVWIGLGGVTGVATWWRLRGAADADIEWACTLLLCLILSPLGWTYYMALAAGPVAAVSLRRQSPEALFGAALFVFPWVLVQHIVSPGNFVVVMSLHLWGALLLLASCLRAAGRPRRAESRGVAT